MKIFIVTLFAVSLLFVSILGISMIILNKFKGTKAYDFVKKHIITDEDLEKKD